MIVRTSSGWTACHGGVEVEVASAARTRARRARSCRPASSSTQTMCSTAVSARSAAALDLVEELLLADDDAVAGVAEQVGDLLGRERVVDRERGRAGVQRRGVDEVELGPVGQHDADRVARPDAEAGEAGGEGADALGVLPPGEPDAAVGRGQRDVVRGARDRRLEGLADRLGRGGRQDVARRRRHAARLKLTTGVVNIDRTGSRPVRQVPVSCPTASRS